jgi:uncharacterized protein (DUF1330 family)
MLSESRTRRSSLEMGLRGAGAMAVGSLLGTSPTAAQENSNSPPVAYVFVQSISVTDPDALARYQVMARQSIAQHGGQFIARGAQVTFLEGDGDFASIGVIHFPSAAIAQEWFTSDDYQAALEVRKTAGEQRIFMVEGSASD